MVSNKRSLVIVSLLLASVSFALVSVIPNAALFLWVLGTFLFIAASFFWTGVKD